jgi:hypothetical protein
VLRTQRYFLELAAFHSSMGLQDEARCSLDRFQMQRQLPESASLPGWLGNGVLVPWDERIARRADFERSVLLADTLLTPERLATSGLLPL